MNTGTKIALAASGGYVLGRTKKMKLAVGLALFLAGRKLPKSPLEMIQQGAGALSKNEQFAELSQQVKGSLLDAGKAAAGRSAERWLAGVSDRLREGIATPDAGTGSEEADQDQDAGSEDADSQDAGSHDAESQEAGQDNSEDSGQEESQDTESDSAESQKSGSQRSSRSSGSSRPTKQSTSSRSRAAKGA